MNLLKRIMKNLTRTSQKSQQSTNNMEQIVMAENQKEMYQWIKGDRFGDIVTVAEDQKDGKWLYFEDGSRINPALKQEFLMRIESEEKALTVASETPTPQANPVQNETTAVLTATTPSVESSVIEPTIMGKMIMKMSKKNVVNVPLQINLNIPTPELYAMMSGGMEEADLNEEIMAVALQQIEIDNLTEYLKENISTFLSEYYS